MYYYLLYITVCTWKEFDPELSRTFGAEICLIISNLQVLSERFDGKLFNLAAKMFYPAIYTVKKYSSKNQPKMLKKVLNSEFLKKLESFWIRFDSSNCKKFPRYDVTLCSCRHSDSFEFQLGKKWRSSLGWVIPFVPCSDKNRISTLQNVKNWRVWKIFSNNRPP